MTDRSKAVLSTRSALDATEVRLQDAPTYGAYVHAKSQLAAMLKLLTGSAPITPAQKAFVNIGLMAAKELDASEPEYASALMLAAYDFQNVSAFVKQPDFCASNSRGSLASASASAGKGCLSPPLLSRLALLYSEPHRHYHTLAHIEALLAHLSTYSHLAKEPELVKAAIWFHDAIYDTCRNDNETLSAELALTELAHAGWGIAAAHRVADMVRATRHHQAEETDTDTLLFLDFDLSVLGASPASYAAYCAAIRSEFNWVNDADYAQGRSRVLKSFISRQAIYRTPTLRDAWENAARINIQRELNGLA